MLSEEDRIRMKRILSDNRGPGIHVRKRDIYWLLNRLEQCSHSIASANCGFAPLDDLVNAGWVVRVQQSSIGGIFSCVAENNSAFYPRWARLEQSGPTASMAVELASQKAKDFVLDK